MGMVNRWLFIYPMVGNGKRIGPMTVSGDGDGENFHARGWLWLSNNQWLVSPLPYGRTPPPLLTSALLRFARAPTCAYCTCPSLQVVPMYFKQIKQGPRFLDNIHSIPFFYHSQNRIAFHFSTVHKVHSQLH
jgi:hypothetical protein